MVGAGGKFSEEAEEELFQNTAVMLIYCRSKSVSIMCRSFAHTCACSFIQRLFSADGGLLENDLRTLLWRTVDGRPKQHFQIYLA